MFNTKRKVVTALQSALRQLPLVARSWTLMLSNGFAHCPLNGSMLAAGILQLDPQVVQ